MKHITLPNELMNYTFVKGLRTPLEAVAAVLDAQGQHYHALALRDAATIVEVFAEVNIEKTATITEIERL